MPKPKIDELLIRSALEPELCRRLRESPDEVFAEFDLTVEERELLRRPDHRLLPLLGAALGRQMKSSPPPQEVPAATEAPSSSLEAHALPDTLLALTVVPCALREDGQFKGISFVLWANPMVEGADPAALPRPAGVALPGEPLEPLHAVLRISAVQSTDAAGNFRMSLWGSFLPSPPASVPPPAESAHTVAANSIGTTVDSAPVQAAVAAVRSAPSSERYDRLVDLLHALHPGDRR